MDKHADLSMKSDEELISDIQNGSMESFKLIYDRYKSRMMAFAYRMIGHRQNAEDCVHDIFILLYQKASYYKPTAKFSSWFYRMARNYVLSYLAKKKVRAASSLDAPLSAESSETLASYLKSPGGTPAEISESNDMKRFLSEGLARLSVPDREVILLCVVEDLPHERVAEIIGVKAHAVAVRLSRAKERLARILGVTLE